MVDGNNGLGSGMTQVIDYCLEGEGTDYWITGVYWRSVTVERLHDDNDNSYIYNLI